MSRDKFGGYKTEVKERVEKMERIALRNKAKDEGHLDIHRGLREEMIGMKTWLHGPLEYRLC